MMTETASQASETSAARAALTVTGLTVSALTIIRVLQGIGYAPCDLCLLERAPYYAAVPVGATSILALWTGHRRAVALGLGLLGVIFAASIVLASYHVGVEWRLWHGPSDCTGYAPAPAAVGDFFKGLNTVKVVRCDEASLLVLGLSLAGWNVLLSSTLMWIAWRGFRSVRW